AVAWKTVEVNTVQSPMSTSACVMLHIGSGLVGAGSFRTRRIFINGNTYLIGREKRSTEFGKSSPFFGFFGSLCSRECATEARVAILSALSQGAITSRIPIKNLFQNLLPKSQSWPFCHEPDQREKEFYALNHGLRSIHYQQRPGTGKSRPGLGCIRIPRAARRSGCTPAEPYPPAAKSL